MDFMPCRSSWLRADRYSVDYPEMAQAGMANPGSARCKVYHKDFPECEISFFLFP